MTDLNPGQAFKALLDQRSITAFQLALVALLVLVLVIDGIDIQLLSLVAPSIIEEWGVEASQFGPALAGALIGMSLGALVGGMLGDRFGRMPLLVISTLLFGVATIVAGMTDSVLQMSVLRIISGIGFGSAAPNAIALAVDWLPERARGIVTSLMSIGTPAGGMIGASLVIVMLPMWGWRATFYACGILTLVIVAFILMTVRESPSWLAANGKPERSRAVVKRCLGLDWDTPATIEESSGEAKPHGKSFLTAKYTRLNLGAGLGFFSLAFVSYALVIWTVIMLNSLGFAMEEAVGAVFAFNIAAVAAAIIAGLIMTRFGTRMTLSVSSALLLACVLALIPVLDGNDAGMQSRSATYVLVGASGGFAGAAMASIYSMMASGYGVECRSGGLGFGMLLGRGGGILASFVGGYLLDMLEAQVWPFLATLALAAAVGIGCAFISDRHMLGRKERERLANAV